MCLGDWDSNNSEDRYVALMDTSHDDPKRPKYRCGVSVLNFIFFLSLLEAWRATVIIHRLRDARRQRIGLLIHPQRRCQLEQKRSCGICNNVFHVALSPSE